MRATVIALALASVAATVAADTKCQAQNILDACASQYKPALDNCKGNDWECYCTQATNLLTCYNVCPNADKSGVQSQVTSYCNAFSAAKPPPSSTVVSAPSSTGASLSSTTDNASSTDTSKEEPSGTESEAAAASTSTDNSAGMVIPAKSFGAVAGLLAIAGVFL